MTDAPQGPTTGITPHICIRDGRGAEAIDWYVRALGATEQVRGLADDGKRLMHAHLHINGALLMLHDDFPEYRGGQAAGTPEGVVLHLQVDDADAWFERAVAAGASVTMPIGDQFWGDRYGQIADPFGFTWSIGAPIRAA
ncbi:MAG: glyoxalase [Proteobacteria bacterium SG_bin5]|nr:MAG: glyoxalase [Proteobacteria bacterium SG_bin5]